MFLAGIPIDYIDRTMNINNIMCPTMKVMKKLEDKDNYEHFV